MSALVLKGRKKKKERDKHQYSSILKAEGPKGIPAILSTMQGPVLGENSFFFFFSVVLAQCCRKSLSKSTRSEPTPIRFQFPAEATTVPMRTNVQLCSRQQGNGKDCTGM